MLNINHALDRMDIRSHTRLGAVQDVRKLIQEDGKAASDILVTLLGIKEDQLPEFQTADQAIMTVQYVVDTAIRNEGNVDDAEIVLADAVRKVSTLEKRPDMSWMHARPAAKIDEAVEEVTEMVDVKVAVKADGSIKKGGRQVLAAALYEKYVVQAEVKPTNAWFKELLVKELGMTSAGASTYAYNCDAEKKLLVKASKGKKGE